MLGLGNRERILLAGIELFSTRGFENTTLTAIQAKAGVAINTFYKYFRDKEQLLNEIYQGLRQLLDATLDLAIERENSRAQFRELWNQMAAFHRKHSHVVAFLDRSQHLGEYLDEGSRALSHIPEPITQLIDRLRQAKIARSAPVDVLGAIIWGSFVELVRLRSLQRRRLAEEDVRAAEGCTWDAIRAIDMVT